jgi:hypothetical protein
VSKIKEGQKEIERDTEEQERGCENRGERLKKRGIRENNEP